MTFILQHIAETEKNTKLLIGVSQCLLGQNVRYDGGNKYLAFLDGYLKSFASYIAICPEMAIGLPSPRPTIGLYKVNEQQTIIRFNSSDGVIIDGQMKHFCQQKVQQLSHLCGYVVCAKSPSCGLNNAKLLDNQSYQFIKFVDGIFTAELRRSYPWMPIADNLQLSEPAQQQHFMIRLIALHRLNQLKNKGLSRQGLLEFHSRYKLLLLAHSQPLYRQLGPFVAKMADYSDLNEFFTLYREQLMRLLMNPATVENHTNVLMHIQGYFTNHLTSAQKQTLTNVILDYRQGKSTLSDAIGYLKKYLAEYPNEYLLQQYYFCHYPDTIC